MAFDGFTVAGSPANAAVAPQGQDARPRFRRGRGQRPARPDSGRPELRLATLHRETGVLTHDLNNLLNVILAASEALAQSLPEGSGSRELADVSQDAAERGAELVRRLLALSEPQPQATPACDAAGALASTVRLARLSAPPGVVIRLEAPAGPMSCLADRGALESALLNLCVNAGHAMPGGGVMTLSAGVSGDTVVLSVRDNGCGMSAEVLARATEPYFTTRRGQGGTGLGLAGVRAFAERSGGRFELASRSGQGLTATLVLPCA
jgi:signal transduction histidine kinase